MKDKLYQEYGFQINYLTYKKNYIFFENYANKYMICKTEFDNKTLENLSNIVNYLDTYAIFFHQIVPNKKGYFFNFGNNNYVVLKLRILTERKVSLEEILKLSNISIMIDTRNLMEEKIDFLEKYLANYENLVLENFNYFVGLAENSITLFNLKGNHEKKYINHRRLHYNESTIDFYNPLNIVMDYKTRDVAEYAKSLFLVGDDKTIEFLRFINIDDWYTYFSRILFPSFYFDEIDNYINSNIEMDKKRISFLANSFEKKLKELYIYISSRVKMPYIEWLSNVYNF